MDNASITDNKSKIAFIGDNYRLLHFESFSIPHQSPVFQIEGARNMKQCGI